ncbi:hypothetical protein H5119_13630 [Pseudoalteromonas sp. SG45-5]|uniref:hypothetical protein n=1 Tax=unclassified Pseudoalteromonas TaxID=194690 RepID=UPI0015FA6F5F|nr:MULTISPECIES: hypothetical protein [unclassified Pseudoalteromonas]MBB1386566.1 hypothetical protein [Pseudoalteromonas sp. SG45-5]MBB1394604.1 hypothetical protein [Pseudoalteromonas sp. SG44-4]MBB1447553.1 hypothetical protein [Pseudoalteromonas sp. SG41-6]
MSQAVTVYRWDDDGAPQLTQTHGSAVDVLKKCLIDGYGTKPPAGWVLEEISQNNKNMIFSPASRAWMYLIYDDGRNSFWGDRAALFGAIDAYNSIEEPISSLNYSSWTAQPSNDEAVFNQIIDKKTFKWLILATKESFYLLLDNIGTSDASAACFVGKLDANGHNLAYTAIGNFGYYKDYDVGQLFSNYSGHNAFLNKKTSFPILVDVNTGVLNSINSIGPIDFHNDHGHYSKSSAFSSSGVWGRLLINNNANKLSALFPFVEIPLSPPKSWPARFEVVGDYLYFNRVRFYLGE